MIKVVNVVQDFNMGGIQSVLLNLLRAFKGDPDIDFSVVVLEKCYGSEFDKAAAEEGLNITYLGAKHSKNRHYYIRKISDFLSYNGKLYLHLKKQKPQIVHTHNTRMIKLISDCMRRTRKNYVWVHTLHSDPYAVHNSHIPYLKQAVNEYGVHPVCLNRTQFEKAKERYGLERCRYIYNMASLERFHNTIGNGETCRTALSIPQDAYVIGTVGRLEAVKNYRFLLRAFAAAAKQNEKALLVFTGDGDEADILKREAKELGIEKRVIFLGIRKDTEKIYPAFDVFVLTSTSESSSLVVLEAQAAGLTCVVSAACPVESVITDRVVIMDKSADDNAWAKELLAPSRFETPNITEKDYTAAAVTKSIKDLYNSLLSKRKNNG